LEHAFKLVNDLADEEILFFEPKSKASRLAAKASRDRIYARPDVVSKIPSKKEEIQVYIGAHTTFSRRQIRSEGKAHSNANPDADYLRRQRYQHSGGKLVSSDRENSECAPHCVSGIRSRPAASVSGIGGQADHRFP
jgi:hypothetical protein